jgi:hypothetical protein
MGTSPGSWRRSSGAMPTPAAAYAAVEREDYQLPLEHEFSEQYAAASIEPHPRGIRSAPSDAVADF